MTPKDLRSDALVRRALSPVSVSDDTPQVSEIIDRLGFQSLMFSILLGSIADSNVTFTVLLEDGDDSGLSDAAAVVDNDLVGTEALAAFAFDNDDEVRSLGYIGNKRFVRMTITPSGNGSAALLAVAAHLSHALAKPVSQTEDS